MMIISAFNEQIDSGAYFIQTHTKPHSMR